MTASGRTCRCGHAASYHQHFNTGTYCGPCGRGICPRYQPDTWLRRLLRGAR